MPFALAGSYAVYARGGARSLHDVDVIDLIHTLSFGEVTEIWAFLGNYLLGEAVDAAGCDLAVHGHAHAGTEKGATEGGTPVRNVAQPVIRSAYALYDITPVSG